MTPFSCSLCIFFDELVVKILSSYLCGFRPVDDYNEIASHFAEVIYVHSYNSKLRVFSKLPRMC